MGSIVWVINGFIVFLPFVVPSIAKDPVSGGWTAWLGATIFFFAALLPIWEGWNGDNAVYFGWGIQQIFRHKRMNVEKADTYRDWAEVDSSGGNSPERPGSEKKWIWWTTDTKYWYQIGFLAGFAQMWAATIFWISGFTGLPEIQNAIMENTPLLNGVYWTPQVIGASGFVISAILYMLDSQKKWYIPAPADLGWQVGFWNLIGAIGFLLCGIFGYSEKSWRQYQSCLSTFWGGWAFLIGSLIQWYIAVHIEPKTKDSSREEKSQNQV